MLEHFGVFGIVIQNQNSHKEFGLSVINNFFCYIFAVHIAGFGIEQLVGLLADLLGGAVVDAQGAGAAADVDAAAAEHHGFAVDALVGITNDEQIVGVGIADECPEKFEAGGIKVLPLINHDGGVARGGTGCEQ